MPSQLTAILAAQWKSLTRLRRRQGLSLKIIPILPMLLWYGVWIAVAAGALMFAANPEQEHRLRTALPFVFLIIVIYWQLAPLLTGSLGATLDLKKLLVYPIPRRHLFGIEILLRVTTSVEILLVLTGLTAGLLLNPAFAYPAAALAYPPFVICNLLVAAGFRNQLERWLARKRVREIAALAMVFLLALPQLLLATGLHAPFARLIFARPGLYWPWTAAARLATGEAMLAGAAVLLAWTAAAYLFGRWQFERTLRFDAQAAEIPGRPAATAAGWRDALWRLPSRLLRDPLAAIVEKELRSLARTPRFRLVFLMGFTFGIIVFLPFTLGRIRPGGAGIPEVSLVMVGAYALLLLGDVAFWNVFGFDRAATQAYFLLPVRVSSVLMGKNIAAGIFVIAEMTAITLVWTLLSLPVTPSEALEAYAVTLTLTFYLLGAGNMSSAYYPRPVSPERSTGAGSAARIRMMLLLIYPAAALPVTLAYAARFAFDSQWAFWGALAFAAGAGGVVYRIGLDSAAERAEKDREGLIRALSESYGPVSA